ncbi:DUF2252 domain-containing protein [Gordonia bronchialis]|uniref:DUF2252 domain-containing protein n=1 Tax=Gordonia bronchialis TaxID=2054 RepID=UPI001CC06206|nr:DUF2252 domain-containing protein [Gordonia bronchialis]UAK37338.1 DUF2252 domain-containing protein [Gordonia bronchialis]
MMSDSAAIDLASCPEPTERADPLSILSAQARNRVAELVPVRNARMAATPFTFYRGAAAVMSADLSRTPDSGVYTQLCGDAHLSNLGLFFSPERRMTFDLNDFDETHPGPFEWDVKRLAASFVVAGRNNGFDDKTNLKCARAVAKAYRRSIAHSVTKSTLDCWYARMDVDELVALIGEKLDTSINQRTQKALKKARHRNSEQALSKLCVIDADGKAHIRSEPPLLVPIHELYPDDVADTANERIDERLHAYRGCLQGHVRALLDQFTMVDVARKVVGVGSVGTRAWIALLVGQNLDDPLFLQIKEAQRSVLADYVPAAGYANEGQRVVEGQRLLQAASDIFLGWTGGDDENGERRDFYVRQLRDGKGSIVVEALEPEAMQLCAQLCGRTLAQAHARTAGRRGIAEFLENNRGFVKQIGAFSIAYADLNDGDHARMIDAIKSGELEVHDLEGPGPQVRDVAAAR